MARFCAEKETDSKFLAAKAWKQNCLIESGSVFSSGHIWNVENIQELDTYFTNNPIEGSGDFFSKLEAQLEPTSPSVKQLAAEMLWVMLICPSNIGPDKKRESVGRIWGWSGEDLDMSSSLLSNETLDGIGSGGTSYNTNRWRELVYFIQMMKALLQLSPAERTDLLSDAWNFAEWLEKIPENRRRQLRHMILFLLYPDHFERIFSAGDRRDVLVAFKGKAKAAIRKMSAVEIDREIAEIRFKQQDDFGTSDLDFYRSPLRDMWIDKASNHWLFCWNPEHWSWDEIAETINRTAAGETVVERWSCSNSSLSPGDKAWMVRLGSAPKGIMATGNIISEVYDAAHYEPAKAEAGETAQYVDIEFTRVLDVFKDNFITDDDLSRITIDKQSWFPQSSGIEIKARSAGLLEKIWDKLAAASSPKSINERAVVIKESTNQILYGPPGTGKTFELNKLTARYIAKADRVSREQWLSQQLFDTRWFDVVFMALYALGGKAKVAEIEQHEFIQQKAKAIGRTKHIKQQIWATLQTHTSELSETVKYNKRQPPFIFDKSQDSQWSLVHEWRETCEELVTQAEELKAGQSTDNQSRYEFVTFHQAYSYEDFVEGIRPIQDDESGELVYRVMPGVFRRICQKAKNDPDNRYAIFIDEINRGNIAKIFGELITLIETDKRATYGTDGSVQEGMELTLPYSGEAFGVPKNLDIYGTMNTADRSIALLDTALRRRFSFKELMPDSGVITGSRGDGYIEDGEGGLINLRAMLDAMNKRIRFLLNRDLMLGHAYLCKVKSFEALKSVLVNQFIPLLQEYFYDDWHRIQLVFGDVGATGEPIEPQVIVHETLAEEDVLGFDHDDFEDLIEYRVAQSDQITPETIRKIYEPRD